MSDFLERFRKYTFNNPMETEVIFLFDFFCNQKIYFIFVGKNLIPEMNFISFYLDFVLKPKHRSIEVFALVTSSDYRSGTL